MNNKSAFSSDEYDKKIAMTLPYYEDIYEQVITLVRAIKSDKISWLDTGCGTGKMAAVALASFDIDRLVLCDNSDAMLKQAKEKLKNSRADFINTYVQKLNYDNEFDVVTAIQLNHYLNRNDRICAIRNCYNALKPNGVFITFENTAPFSETGKDISLKRWKQYQIEHGKSAEESQEHINRYGKDYFPISPSEHIEIMKECGFMTVEFLWMSYMQMGIYGIK